MDCKCASKKFLINSDIIQNGHTNRDGLQTWLKLASDLFDINSRTTYKLKWIEIVTRIVVGFVEAKFQNDALKHFHAFFFKCCIMFFFYSPHTES